MTEGEGEGEKGSKEGEAEEERRSEREWWMDRMLWNGVVGLVVMDEAAGCTVGTFPY